MAGGRGVENCGQVRPVTVACQVGRPRAGDHRARRQLEVRNGVARRVDQLQRRGELSGDHDRSGLAGSQRIDRSMRLVDLLARSWKHRKAAS